MSTETAWEEKKQEWTGQGVERPIINSNRVRIALMRNEMQGIHLAQCLRVPVEEVRLLCTEPPDDCTPARATPEQVERIAELTGFPPMFFCTGDVQEGWRRHNEIQVQLTRSLATGGYWQECDLCLAEGPRALIESEGVRLARASGWEIDEQNDLATCPDCRSRIAATSQPPTH